MSYLRLGDAAEKIGSGATPLGGEKVYRNCGVALIRSQNVYNDGFSREGLVFIGDGHAEELSHVEVKPGDVLLNITGDSVARVCQAPKDVLPARVNQHVAIIRPRQDLLDARFLRYFLTSPSMQQHMLALASAGGTRNALTKGMIGNFRVPALPVAAQRAIAHVLGTLDDKIELNRRMNETLEAMARAIFKSWFVDFDPVRAKAEGRQPFGMDAETAALFPNSFQDSPLGKIPRGWKVARLGDVAENPRRGVSPGEVPRGTPYMGLEHMPRKSIALSDWGLSQEVASNKFSFRQEEILFGKLRPYFHKVGVAVQDGVCSTDILVIGAKSEEWYGLVLGHVSSEEFVSYADAVSTGTKMPRTNWRDIARYQMALPDSRVTDAFNRFARTVVEMIRGNIEQSQTLGAIRDTLLPKLISGEVRIKDTKSLVEASN